jgi:gas vesicle protein
MLDKRNNNIGWFLAGLGLGAVAAILYAPRSGRETREAILTGVDDGREYLTSIGRNVREQVSGLVDSGKKIVSSTKRHVNAAIDAGRETIHDATAVKRS